MRLQKDFVYIVISKALLRANTFGQMGSLRRLFSRLFLPQLLGKKDTPLGKTDFQILANQLQGHALF